MVDFHLNAWWFSEFNILKVILKSNSLSINKKNNTHIKCSLLNKALHFVKTEIFSLKLSRKATKLYPIFIISSNEKWYTIFQKSFTMSMDMVNDSTKKMICLPINTRSFCYATCILRPPALSLFRFASGWVWVHMVPDKMFLYYISSSIHNKKI